MKNKVAISGGGLVGSLLSIYLGKRGYHVSVYEKRKNPALNQQDSGRSINLAISHRGLKALDKVGLKEKALALAIPMHGRMIHSVEGRTTFLPYGKEGQHINSISRAGLNSLLVSEALKYDNIDYSFESAVSAVMPDEKSFVGPDQQLHNYSVLIGADGAFSVVRKALERTERFSYSQEFLTHGYKELCISADAQGCHRLDKNALHIWPRKQFMLIALPNPDGSFTCTLFLPFEGKNSFQEIEEKGVLPFFTEHFPDAAELIDDLESDFTNNPTGSLATIKCYPWSYKGSTSVIGDAAHAIVPFYGQGMNAGFEDCRIFDEELEQADTWEDALAGFQESRKADADAIAELAVMNFIEMRDLVADPAFQQLKNAETLIAERYPGYQSLYSLVTFSDTPYSEALKKGIKEREILQDIIANNIEIGSDEFWKQVESEMEGFL